MGRKICLKLNFSDSLDETLENTAFSVSGWEISVPQKDDLAWSIVLSYLLSEDFIKNLYKSPYIVSKLAEASFEVDPRTTDSDGLSALYHAVALGKVTTLHNLYYFAVNNCYQSESTYRNPDSQIVTNLLQMEEILSADFSKFEAFKNEKGKKIVSYLLRLNKFLIEVNKKIISIKNQNYYESINETVFEACKRRDIVISILHTYEEFFEHAQQDTNLSRLDDYITFKNYYDLIDVTAAVLFFDNILFLKERLVLEDQNQFSQIESSFFFLIIYQVLFDKINFLIYLNKIVPAKEDKLNSLFIFPLIGRLDNLNKIKEFSKNLNDTVINESNVVKCLPESEVYSILKSYPVFKDSIHLERLKQYINIAINIKVTDIKSVLVIERVLQVIGEYITPEKDNDYTFRRFLAFILPRDIVHILHRTRNELSHLKSYVFKPKAECEKHISLFRSIQKEIISISYNFKLVFEIQELNKLIHLKKFSETKLEQVKSMAHLYVELPVNLINQEENTVFYKNIFHEYRYVYQKISEIVLYRLENYIENEISWTEDCEKTKKLVVYALWPLKWLIQLLHYSGDNRAAVIMDAFETLNNCNKISPISDLKDKTNIFLLKCGDLFSNLLSPSYRIINITPVKSIENIEHFLKILKGFCYLSDQEKDDIRKEIPMDIKQSVCNREKLIKSIKEDFSLKIDRESSELQIFNLSKKKKDKFFKLYQQKDTKALDILQSLDPIAELEDIFSKNSVDKKKYEALCNTMNFSDQTKKLLGKLVAGQRKKIPGNNLLNLLNRIQFLKKLLIEDNEEVLNLRKKVKRQISREYVTDKTVSYYLKYPCLKASVEMLLSDCMSAFKNQKTAKNPFIKSSKLYSGINLRNVIIHGSPILETLCVVLDPEDLPSDLIRKAFRLIDDEDAIEAMLELYQCLKDDYHRLLQVMQSDEKDDYLELKTRILNCKEWENYCLLLPHRPQH